MNEPLGIVDSLQYRRESLVARLSPDARHRAFPTIYARPMPIPNELSSLRGDISVLSARCQQLEIENEQLKRRLAQRVIELEEVKRPSACRILIGTRNVSVTDVMRAYLKALENAGHLLDNTPYTAQDLTGPRRARASAWPRAIAMWLCRRLCKGASLPMIGLAFGGRDHTTVMHACARSAHIMDSVPTLKAAALVVLTTFEGEPTA